MAYFLFLFLFSPLTALADAEMRIASLLPSNTEILYALDAQRVVGVSNFCDYPPQARQAAKIGDLLQPNMELLVKLKPDLVFTGNWKTGTAGARLRKLGFEVVEVPDADSIADLEKNIMLIASRTGRTEQARKLLLRIENSMRSAGRGPARPAVYVELDSPHWTTGGRSYISDLIEKAGGRNVFGQEPKGYFKASWESIVLKNPDVILSLTRSARNFEKLPLAKRIKAVRLGHILRPANPDIYLRPSPRVSDAVQELSGLLRKYEAP